MTSCSRVSCVTPVLHKYLKVTLSATMFVLVSIEPFSTNPWIVIGIMQHGLTEAECREATTGMERMGVVLPICYALR